MTAAKIVPHLWFDDQAVEAAAFYTSIFPDSRVTDTMTLHDTPSGDCDVVSFELAGQRFMAISAGPMFQFNPAISFILNFDPSKDPDARAHLDATWKRLAEDGLPLVPLDTYPFSQRFGWIQDRYGLSWQLILSDPDGEDRPFIVPSLMFTRDNVGRAEEAISLYTSVFEDARQGQMTKFPAGREPDEEGTVMFADFTLMGQWFAAMDSAQPHQFTFNEAVSLMVECEDQEEIDRYWKALSAVPDAEQCGWLKDRFGVSWQIVPASFSQMMQGTPDQVASVTQAFLHMKKVDLDALRRAYEAPSAVVR